MIYECSYEDIDGLFVLGFGSRYFRFFAYRPIVCPPNGRRERLAEEESEAFDAFRRLDGQATERIITLVIERADAGLILIGPIVL